MKKYSNCRLIFAAALVFLAIFPWAALSAPSDEPDRRAAPDFLGRLFMNRDFDKSEKGGEGGAAPPSVFDKDGRTAGVDRLELKRTLTLSGKRISEPVFSVGQSVVRNRGGFPLLSGGKKKRMAVSMISSALLPGLGEFFLYLDTGSKSILARAIGFMALEGYLWYGYDYNHDKGKDFKRQYEAYGDEHWSESDFLEQHPVCYDLGGCDTWEEYNQVGKEYSSEYYYFYYTPREVDTEEYYENMGKYDAFLYGWDDWNGEYAHLGGSPNFWTPHRTEYWGLRGRSNDYLLKADRHIMGMIASRVVSMIHAGWLASKTGRDEEGWSLELRSGRLYSRIGVMYRF